MIWSFLSPLLPSFKSQSIANSKFWIIYQPISVRIHIFLGNICRIRIDNNGPSKVNQLSVRCGGCGDEQNWGRNKSVKLNQPRIFSMQSLMKWLMPNQQNILLNHPFGLWFCFVFFQKIPSENRRTFGWLLLVKRKIAIFVSYLLLMSFFSSGFERDMGEIWGISWILFVYFKYRVWLSKE